MRCVTENENKRTSELRRKENNRPTVIPTHHQLTKMSWEYQGDCGCSFWQDLGLTENYTGKKQSPIDINTFVCTEVSAKKMPLMTKKLKPFEGMIENTGFTIKVTPKKPQEHVFFKGEEYKMIQFHFHSPSEHTVDDDFFQVELHLVHQSVTNPDALLVIGFFFDDKAGKSKGNDFMEHILDSIPDLKGNAEKIEDIDFSSLDLTSGFWHYAGSLTTPPCSETVSWIVMKKIHNLSREQHVRYTDYFKMVTNRPTQPLCGRSILSVNAD